MPVTWPTMRLTRCLILPDLSASIVSPPHTPHGYFAPTTSYTHWGYPSTAASSVRRISVRVKEGRQIGRGNRGGRAAAGPAGAARAGAAHLLSLPLSLPWPTCLIISRHAFSHLKHSSAHFFMCWSSL